MNTLKNLLMKQKKKFPMHLQEILLNGKNALTAILTSGLIKINLYLTRKKYPI